MRAFVIGAFVFLLTFVLLLAYVVNQRTSYEDACDQAGGVPIKSHLGPRVCIDSDALIEVSS
jgi:hypothetical protein